MKSDGEDPQSSVLHYLGSTKDVGLDFHLLNIRGGPNSDTKGITSTCAAQRPTDRNNLLVFAP